MWREGFFLPNNTDFWKTRKNKAGLSLPFRLSDMSLANAFEPVTVASCILLTPRLADSHGFVVGLASFLPFPKHWDEARVYWVVGARVLTKSMVNLLIVRPCPTECCGGQTPTLMNWIPWCYHREPWLQEQERMTIFGKLHGCISRFGVLTSTENKIFGISFFWGELGWAFQPVGGCLV